VGPYGLAWLEEPKKMRRKFVRTIEELACEALGISVQGLKIMRQILNSWIAP
jgi:hypothetical protein